MDPKFGFIAPGVPGLVERVKPNMLGCLTDRYPSLYPRGEVPEVPAWIGFDKQVLKQKYNVKLKKITLNLIDTQI